MEHDATRILYLIEKLRGITLAVQVVPFAYSALYVVTMVLYLFVSENICGVLDTLFYVSPVTSAWMLIFSRILKLCKWHRLACLLPVFPQVMVFVDYHVIGLSRIGATISVLLATVMAVLLLIAAYNVFLKPKDNERKRRTTRDAGLLQVQDQAQRMHDGGD